MKLIIDCGKIYKENNIEDGNPAVKLNIKDGNFAVKLSFVDGNRAVKLSTSSGMPKEMTTGLSDDR